MRIFAISDLHTDMKSNMDWVKGLDSARWKQDILIVAGDVSDRLEVVIETMAILKQKFAEVFFSFGNHDVWDKNVNSLEKIDQLYHAMQELGIKCEPTLVDGRYLDLIRAISVLIPLLRDCIKIYFCLGKRLYWPTWTAGRVGYLKLIWYTEPISNLF